jgi:hypothetical protein
MKKPLVLIIPLCAAFGTNAFADGYVLFFTAPHNVYDEFTTPGMGVVSRGDVTATFLWALTGTADPLGTEVATTGVNYTANNWSTVSSMLSSGWNIAEDAGNGNAEADVATINGVQQGAIIYNEGTYFQLANTGGGDTYQFAVIGWDNLGGATTLEEGMIEDVPMGWSNPFNYATGATATATVEEFSQSGMNPFGIAPVPEPATLALAGLGGLSLLVVRRAAKLKSRLHQ